MIRFLTTRANAAPVRDFREHGAGGLSSRIEALTYETVDPARLPEDPAAWIFADLESLTIRELRAARTLWTRLARNPRNRLLNHPGRAMRRYELLRTMREEGINDFGAYRAIEGRRPERYPVFLRSESQHTGPRTGLLADVRALADSLARMVARGIVRDDVLIVEYTETRGSDGVWRKYGATVVAGRVIPVELIHADHWISKYKRRIVSAATEAAELDYLRTNPHEAALGRIFALARIDFGRIDYAVIDGAIRVWEINTNPAVVTDRGPSADRSEAFALAFGGLCAALAAIEPASPEPDGPPDSREQAAGAPDTGAAAQPPAAIA